MSFTHILNKADPKNVGYMQEQFARLDPTQRWSIKVEQYAKTRTEEQNAISHAWYAQLAKELRDDTPLAYKCFCKLHFGVPILRAEDDEFRTVYDTAIKSLSYEKKLEVMKILPVTSIMKTKQLSQYLEAMQAHFADRVKLEFPAAEEHAS
jgi:hypothetical protein